MFAAKSHIQNAATPYAHIGRLFTGAMTTAHTLRDAPGGKESACALADEDIGLNRRSAEIACNSTQVNAISMTNSGEIASKLFSDIDTSGDGSISKQELRYCYGSSCLVMFVSSGILIF